MEVMVSAAKLADTQKKATGEVDKKVIEENLMESLPSCEEYLGLLMDFALKYGGGLEAPLIVFLDSIYKQYRSGKTLGGTFLHGRGLQDAWPK